MPSFRYDLCAIGNALVDILVSVEEEFLRVNGIAKGAMVLVDDETAKDLYERVGATVEMSSGGSAANTLAGFASLGGKAAFMGKVGRDSFGDVFAHDLRAQDIHFSDVRSFDLSTGRCLVMVTPDAQRSMNTFLGAAVEFGEEDVDPEIIRNANVTYLEGYLFDKPAAKQAFRKAARIAHEAGHKMALTLSDTFCVLRHREEFITLIKDNVDILFANEGELMALYQTKDLNSAIESVRAHVDIAVTTRGDRGAIVATEAQTYEIPVQTPPALRDTTGAGDLYAAGFLFGLSRQKNLAEAGHIGALAAAEVISHFGPRPKTDLAKLISK